MITIVLLLTISAASASETPPVIDGVIGESEWEFATRGRLSGGGEVRVLRSGDRLFVAVEGGRRGIAHVCVASKEAISILHASAALGDVTYRRSGETWTPANEFAWSLREPRGGGSPPAADRNAHLETRGWLANASNTSTPHREFELRLLPDMDRIAVAFLGIDEPQSVSFWPPTVEDDCIRPDLLGGHTPPQLRFNPQNWSVLPPPTAAGASR